MRSPWSVVLLACGSALAQPALSQPLGHAERGRALAEAECAACHAVRPGEGQAPAPLTLPFPAEPLPFEDIAGARGVTEMILSVWLKISHPGMPDLVLSVAEVEDLSAYILSLRGPPA